MPIYGTNTLGAFWENRTQDIKILRSVLLFRLRHRIPQFYTSLLFLLTVTMNDNRQADTSPTSSPNDILGLDWDGVISHFPEEMIFLASKFNHVVVITLNHTVTLKRVREVLQKKNCLLEICPDDRRENYTVWKAEVCKQHSIALMIDDDGFVVSECRSQGVRCLAVNAALFPASLRDWE
jgi:hypothetical protein